MQVEKITKSSIMKSKSIDELTQFELMLGGRIENGSTAWIVFISVFLPVLFLSFIGTIATIGSVFLKAHTGETPMRLFGHVLTDVQLNSIGIFCCLLIIGWSVIACYKIVRNTLKLALADKKLRQRRIGLMSLCKNRKQELTNHILLELNTLSTTTKKYLTEKQIIKK